jgi:hypothetical protein
MTDENNSGKKGGFSILALFFAAQYYAGYGKFGRGLIFAVLLSANSILGIIAYIYAGFKAKKELPVGEKSFSWGACIGMIVVHFILAITITIATEMSMNSGNSYVNITSQQESSTSNIDQIDIPDRQQEFLNLISEFSEEYSSAPNDLKKSAVRTKRANSLKELFSKSLSVTNWVGNINEMSTTGEGNAHIQVKLVGVDVSFANTNNELSDLVDKTLINQSSPLFTKVADFSEGDQVFINGVLRTDFDTDEGGDFLDESFSFTEAGSMTDPIFLIKFNDIDLSE